MKNPTKKRREEGQQQRIKTYTRSTILRMTHAIITKRNALELEFLDTIIGCILQTLI